MGYRQHVPVDGRRVGTVTVEDPRAGLMRIQIDRDDGRGLVDVTRPWTDTGGGRYQVVAASDVDGWIAVLNHQTALIAQERGHVVITFAPSDEAMRLLNGGNGQQGNVQ